MVVVKFRVRVDSHGSDNGGMRGQRHWLRRTRCFRSIQKAGKMSKISMFLGRTVDCTGGGIRGRALARWSPGSLNPRAGKEWCSSVLAVALAVPFATSASAADFRNHVPGPDPKLPPSNSVVGGPQDAAPPPISVCSGRLAIGQIVELVANAPDGNSALRIGTLGRVLSADGLAVLVEFSGLTAGHDGMGWAKTPVIANVGSNRWWVQCDDVVAQPNPRPAQDGAVVVVGVLGAQAANARAKSRIKLWNTPLCGVVATTESRTQDPRHPPAGPR